MSLILEALRKSEAERRRGLPPDLHAELPPAARRRRIALPAWAWAILAIALLALLAWLWNRHAAGTAPPTDDTAQLASPQAAAEDPPATPAPTALPARTPASRTQAAPETVAISEPEPAAPAPAPAIPSPPPTEGVEAKRPPPIPPPAPPPTPAERPADPAPTETGRVLDIAELDPDTRQALPPLKMSMHLWNEVPSQRLVIFDGRRVGEGDRVGDASIVRIERDAVLLDWQGRRIRIPVR